MGLSIGYVLEERYVNFTPRSVWWYQALKLAVGLFVVFALRLVIKMLLPELPISHLIRYGVIGLWIALGVPIFFNGRNKND